MVVEEEEEEEEEGEEGEKKKEKEEEKKVEMRFPYPLVDSWATNSPTTNGLGAGKRIFHFA